MYRASTTSITLSSGRDPVSHFLASVNELFEHALKNLSDGDMVGITIRNRVNQNNKPIGTSFRRKNRLAGDVIWSLFEKVSLTQDLTP